MSEAVPAAARPPRPRFGDLVVQKGLASPPQVAAALRVQAERAAIGRHQNLGEVLVEQGVLDAAQVRSLLSDLDRAILFCPACAERYNVPSVRRSAARCPVDNTPLVAAQEGAPVGVAATLAADPDTLIGRELGRCRVLELLGKGGMGAVYKARHVGLGRDVALKILPSADQDPTFARRLLFEARTIARLDHPNLVQVFDVGFQEGWFFMVMKLVRGRSLDERLAENPRPPVDFAVSLVRDVARGLEAAHKEGVIHRDLKPGNVLVTEDGRACLTDFGLSRDNAAPDELDGMIVGTPCYMAPEIWDGKTVDGRTDLYALGVIFYQMVTGQKPFEASSLADLRALHTAGKAKAPRSLNPECPPGVQAVLAKMMARSPDRRYPVAAALLADLDRLASGEDPKALTDTGRKVKCGFCDALNRSDAAKCETCGERLGARAAAPLELALRDGETRCACGVIYPERLRACPSCRAPRP